ncbi:MAG: NgoPII family restriction endonuclease [Fibrella sp.]|nr:NgoPII family restriction endonuclease [Armatimonadota bacterium]
MTNILTTFMSIAQNPINGEGDALDISLQNAFASIPPDTPRSQRIELLAASLVYLGNPTNPPDMMLRNGDAVQILRVPRDSLHLQLNSAYAMQKLYPTYPGLTSSARNCEPWSERDMIYAIGVEESRRLTTLWMIYGDCFAPSNATFERNSGDELRIYSPETKAFYLPGRGSITNPIRLLTAAFNTQSVNFESEPRLVAVMRAEKYLSLPEPDRTAIENASGIEVHSVNLQNPEDTTQPLATKLLVLRP